MSRRSVWLLVAVSFLSGCSLYGPPYCPAPGSPSPPRVGAGSGPLYTKALEFDHFFQTKIRPERYGGVVNVRFADSSFEKVKGYDDLEDSAIWTGTYLAAESFRYAVESDPEKKQQALDNARGAVHTLDFFLHVTGTPGLLARFAAPLDQASIFLNGACCPAGTATDPSGLCCPSNNNCTTGKAPDGTPVFWLGGTSRDQYSGWFYGMGIAERLIDDPELRQMIRSDMTELTSALQGSSWKVPDGTASGATGGHVEPYEKLSWLLATSAAQQEPACGWYEKAVRDVLDVQATITPLDAAAEWLNQYMQYYAFNLDFINYYNLVQLEPNHSRRQAYLDSLNRNSYRWVRGTGNVFFDYTDMALNGRTDQQTLKSDRAALGEFPNPPHKQHRVTPPQSKLSQISLDLYHLNEKADPKRILFAPRAENAYLLKDRCLQDFIWQQSPFMICCEPVAETTWIPADLQGYCNGLPKLSPGPEVLVYPGADYLLAYWMGRYYGFLGPED